MTNFNWFIIVDVDLWSIKLICDYGHWSMKISIDLWLVNINLWPIKLISKLRTVTRDQFYWLTNFIDLWLTHNDLWLVNKLWLSQAHEHQYHNVQTTHHQLSTTTTAITLHHNHHHHTFTTTIATTNNPTTELIANAKTSQKSSQNRC